MCDNATERGQVLVMATAFLLIGTTMLLGLFHLSLIVREKIRLQMSADMAVLSALNVQANALNAIALANRSIVAHDSLSAQINAIVSESTFNRKLLDRFSRIIRFIPTVGPILSQILAKGGRVIESFSRSMAKTLVPASQMANKLISSERSLILHTLPLNSLKAAERAVRVNTPEAEIWPPSRMALLKQTGSLVRASSPLDSRQTQQVIRGSMSKRSLRRNWRIRMGGISIPVKKIGGTSIRSDDFNAYDTLRMKVFRRLKWRWKTVLQTESSASRFRYRTHGKLIDISRDNLPSSLTLVLTSEGPELAEILSTTNRTLVAVSAGEVYYRRPDRSDEKPNLMNPFWKTRLTPVALDPVARKILPDAVLREVRH